MSPSATDRNFDDLADRFEQRIYGSFKGRLREELVWSLLEEHIAALFSPVSLTVLDAAAGLGQMTERLARLGHHITANDISAEMLRRAQNRLLTAGISTDKVSWQHGPIQEFCQRSRQQFDVIICHALLEWLVEPRRVLDALLEQLKPGGKLSLLFYNRHALIMKNALAGNINVLLPENHRRQPKRKGLSPPNAQYPQDILQWMTEKPCEVINISGIRVLCDWMPTECTTEENHDLLLAIEKRYGSLDPYRYTGRYVHMVVQKC